MSESATFLKVGATSILLRMLEEPNVVLRDMTLENPIRADPRDQPRRHLHPPVRLANGRGRSAVEIQAEYLTLRCGPWSHARCRRSSNASSTCGSTRPTGIEKGPLSLDRERDWVIKHNLIEAYRDRHGLSLTASPRSRSWIGSTTTSTGIVGCSTGCRLAASSIACAMTPRSSRRSTSRRRRLARRLRGEFIRRAKERKRDYTSTGCT